MYCPVLILHLLRRKRDEHEGSQELINKGLQRFFYKHMNHKKWMMIKQRNNPENSLKIFKYWMYIQTVKTGLILASDGEWDLGIITF